MGGRRGAGRSRDEPLLFRSRRRRPRGRDRASLHPGARGDTTDPRRATDRRRGSRRLRAQRRAPRAGDSHRWPRLRGCPRARSAYAVPRIFETLPSHARTLPSMNLELARPACARGPTRRSPAPSGWPAGEAGVFQGSSNSGATAGWRPTARTLNCAREAIAPPTVTIDPELAVATLVGALCTSERSTPDGCGPTSFCAAPSACVVEDEEPRCGARVMRTPARAPPQMDLDFGP